MRAFAVTTDLDQDGLLPLASDEGRHSSLSAHLFVVGDARPLHVKLRRNWRTT